MVPHVEMGTQMALCILACSCLNCAEQEDIQSRTKVLKGYCISGSSYFFWVLTGNEIEMTPVHMDLRLLTYRVRLGNSHMEMALIPSTLG